MKKPLALFLSAALLLTSCGIGVNDSIADDNTNTNYIMTSAETTILSTTETTTVESTSAISSPSGFQFEPVEVEDLDFKSLNDPNLMRFVEDSVYTDLVNQLDSDKYFVENVEAVYVSKEYLDELAYNSRENVYFGYKLSELDQAFQGERYVFTLGDDGHTDVVPFEKYDDTYDQVVRNVAIGTGVILLCVTVSAVTAGAGAPAVSMIFAASAKTATTFALSSGVISGVSAGVIEGIETHDFDKAVKAASLKGSEGFMWGAVTGAIAGGAGEAIGLKGAELNGLKMDEAAIIQKESKYPLDVIKQFSSMEQFEVCKEAGLTAEMVNGKTALIRIIDLNFVDDATGMTNLQRMQKGLAALDPSGKAYELHHIGQHADSTLAILTQEEHRLGESYKIWHKLDGESEIDRAVFKGIKEAFWKSLAQSVA